jgi:hypothetical protein
MTNAANDKAAAMRHCRSCHAEIGPADRFCSACGAQVLADVGTQPAPPQRKHRRNAAVMFLSGVVIVLFAAIHRDPADLILVVAFALPLCGAGAITWRMA